jgi:hypothetical protein
MTTKKVRLLTIVLMFGCVSSVVSGQGSTASLSGVVHDQQNLVVPAASVRIEGIENTFSRTITTASDGTFEIAGLLPGEYKLTVDLQGFARRSRSKSP